MTKLKQRLAAIIWMLLLLTVFFSLDDKEVVERLGYKASVLILMSMGITSAMICAIIVKPRPAVRSKTIPLIQVIGRERWQAAQDEMERVSQDVAREEEIKRRVKNNQRVNTQYVKFCGWTYADKEDEEYLRSMGVEGEMRWRRAEVSKGVDITAAHNKTGRFEYCDITMEVANKLKHTCPYFCFSSFTAVDKDDNQTMDQPLWYWTYDEGWAHNGEGDE